MGRLVGDYLWSGTGSCLHYCTGLDVARVGEAGLGGVAGVDCRRAGLERDRAWAVRGGGSGGGASSMGGRGAGGLVEPNLGRGVGGYGGRGIHDVARDGGWGEGVIE